jgi:hypothetical protein
VLTSGPILGTLVEIVTEQRCDVAGVIDDTQVDEVFHQWLTNGVSAWKIPLLRQVLEGAPFSGKASTKWSPSSLHDFMHAKVVVADDIVFVGSFNFSRSGGATRRTCSRSTIPAWLAGSPPVGRIRARYRRPRRPRTRVDRAARPTGHL